MAAATSNSHIPKPPFASPPSGGDLLKIQMGGAKFQQQVLDWTQQSNHLYLTVLFVMIFMWAVYSEKIPMQYRWQLNTTLGRLLLLIILHIVFLLGGWIPALLFAIAIAMTWANRPLYKPAVVQEGFGSGAERQRRGMSGSYREGFATGNSPLLSPRFGNSRIEGFGDNIKVTDADPHMWFVEKALKENPQRIVQDRIQTFAVQEDNTAGSSRTSK